MVVAPARLRTWAWWLTFVLAAAINLTIGVAGVWALRDDMLVWKYGTTTYWLYVAIGIVTVVALVDRLRRPAQVEVGPLEALVVFVAAGFCLVFLLVAALMAGLAA